MESYPRGPFYITKYPVASALQVFPRKFLGNAPLHNPDAEKIMKSDIHVLAPSFRGPRPQLAGVMSPNIHSIFLERLTALCCTTLSTLEDCSMFHSKHTRQTSTRHSLYFIAYNPVEFRRRQIAALEPQGIALVQNCGREGLVVRCCKDICF